MQDIVDLGFDATGLKDAGFTLTEVCGADWETLHNRPAYAIAWNAGFKDCDALASACPKGFNLAQCKIWERQQVKA